MIESAEEEKSSWLRIFTYNKDRPEPRLFALPYSRELHEQVEKQMMGRLRKGQTVLGSLSKITKSGKGKAKPGLGESEGKGGGSESQDQVWEFHPLRPSDFLRKPENE